MPDARLRLAGEVTEAESGAALLVALEGRTLELTGDAVEPVKRLAEAAREALTPAALEKASGLDKRSAAKLVRELRAAGVLEALVPARTRLSVIGRGGLAEAIKGQLALGWISAATKRARIVVLGELGEPAWHQAVQKHPAAALGVSTEGAAVWVGPWLRADHGLPCPLCLQLRRAAASWHLPVTTASSSSAWPLAAASAIAMAATPPGSRALRVEGMASTAHRLLAVGTCPRCQAGTRTAAQVAAAFAIASDSPEPEPEVREAFTDALLGPLALRHHALEGAFRSLPLVVGGLRTVTATPAGDALVVCAGASGIFGSGYSLARRELVAFCEGVERYSSLTQRPDVVGKSFAQLGDRAVDPNEAIVSPRRPSAGEKLAWSWAIELGPNRPVLVPFDAFAVRPVHVGALTDEPFFTGGAVHVSPARALQHALFECIERDAYLLAFYLKLPLSRLELPADDDSDSTAARRFLEAHGVTLEFFDLQIDLPVPTVLCVATAKRHSGAWPQGGRVLSASAGATELQAIERATSEVLGQYSALSSVPEGADPGVDPISQERAAWWPMFARYLAADAPHPFAFAGGKLRAVSAQPAPALEGLIAAMRERGLTAYARPGSGPEVAASGLHAVKVHVPQLVRPTRSRAEIAFASKRFAQVAAKWNVSAEPSPHEHPLA